MQENPDGTIKEADLVPALGPKIDQRARITVRAGGIEQAPPALDANRDGAHDQRHEQALAALLGHERHRLTPLIAPRQAGIGREMVEVVAGRAQHLGPAGRNRINK